MFDSGIKCRSDAKFWGYFGTYAEPVHIEFGNFMLPYTCVQEASKRVTLILSFSQVVGICFQQCQTYLRKDNV